MKLVRCGKWYNSGETWYIYCDITTGDVFVKKPYSIELMMKMAIKDPIDANDVVLDNLMESAEADGVIMSDTYIVTLNGDIAAYHKCANFAEVVQNIEFSLQEIDE